MSLEKSKTSTNRYIYILVFVNITDVKFIEWRGISMGKVLVKNVVKRRKGYLYYVDGKGNFV